MGMVLIEFLTGRPPYTRDRELLTMKFLLDEVKLQFDETDGERLISFSDANAQWPRRTSKDLGALAVTCVQPDVCKRPTFRNLAVMLQAMSTTGGHWKPICSGE